MGLVENPETISLIHESDGLIEGFILGSLIPAPPVYDPGGPTCLVDDFVVASPKDWGTTGRLLLTDLCKQAAQLGAAQVVVVCGPLDETKRRLLLEQDLTVASEWFTHVL